MASPRTVFLKCAEPFIMGKISKQTSVFFTCNFDHSVMLRRYYRTKLNMNLLNLLLLFSY